MKKNIYIIIAIIVLHIPVILSQEETAAEGDPVEIFLIENFVTPETPHKLMVSYSTSVPVKSKLIIDSKITIPVSENFADNHKTEVDLTKYNFDDTYIPFVIETEDSTGKIVQSERFEFEFPREVKIEGESNFLLLCLFGGAVFGLPAPAYVKWGGKNYFGLTKEIPLLFIPSSGYSYPAGYFSLEYSHIINAPVKNYFRVGYKHIIEIPGIEYISPGINGFTNFKGFNGISPEISLGLFKIYNTFTFYTRYRFNAKPGDTGSEFHEISIGLYSGFFAIYL
jgi:hypothetical protein